MKKVVLIAGTEHTRETLHEQLESYIGGIAQVESYAIDKGIKDKIKADIVIISTSLIYNEAILFIEGVSKVIVARRVLNYKIIENLLFIPEGEKVLFVNDCKETTQECIDWLKKLGLNHVEYIPYYPGCELKEKINYAITPGEIDIVPKDIANIIDIGPRLIDIVTIAEILKELNVYDEKWEDATIMYLDKIVSLAKKFADISKEKTRAFNHIKVVMDGMKEAVLAFDNKGKIIVSNENLKFIVGAKGNIVGKSIREIFAGNNIIEFLLSCDKEASNLFEIRGEKYIITKFILDKDNISIATLKSQKDLEELEKQMLKDLYRKGYYAKYSFEDIIGNSIEINYIKDIGRKIAKNDLTVLIEGESGTGKELFASAIHNESMRKNKPFVAVNFSSLPENLAESELFGYEEGAFTGALKGGKKGLFEQADGGTIFLDEIGDASLKLQTKLLRVLQEKEIMRIGGNKIIPIDVRVIAATNKNLRELVEKGEFREDLYYRLKVMYIKLPPLRQRKEDIKVLLDYFISKKDKGLKIKDEVVNILINYNWPGNIRELKNLVEYMVAVCNGSEIDKMDLPLDMLHYDNMLRQDLKLILDIIEDLRKRGENASRRKIERICREKGINLTEQMIRTRLKELEKMGYVKSQKGRVGTMLL
ncbi:sigma-54 interaction domain-containing protein [Thermobrachium celere]|uniref:Phosphocarrier HPr/sensory box protein/sigma-54 dependent transcriptional regulator n=1 Tax=Thermobrachium celere DSM 8682 TaxID=941824 RepID=R7RSX2_9CLOT|nr:sigma 54-interacting transcriptional regulator [Thermobrachium celere]CDF59302.1 phosphocarrier HPr/sensory box protein/sigma-54 dependent transcriptional regulator [Thermobrachium celere DSM 8682]